MIRPAVTTDIPRLAQVHIQSWLETYTGLIPDDVLNDTITLESRELQGQRTLANPRMMVFVAEVSGAVVGFCSLAVAGKHGEIYTLYLLKAHQGLGIGKQLFNSALEYAKLKGARSQTLWVLADNPSHKFYEHMGGILEDQRTERIGKIDLLGVMYEFWL